MTDQECVRFLQWCLPELRYRWRGFRRVRRQVCRRINARMQALGLDSGEQYRCYIEQHPGEWRKLDGFCALPISRFWRDREVFSLIRTELMPSLMETASIMGHDQIRCLSVGCCNGEEPYSLMILWELGLSEEQKRGVSISISATEVNEQTLERAGQASYPFSSIRNLPPEFRESAFDSTEDWFTLKPRFRLPVRFLCQDIRSTVPEGFFHLILCRNLVFTYFEKSLQIEVLDRMYTHLTSGGFLVIGLHESLPKDLTNCIPYEKRLSVYQKVSCEDKA
ncbi:MAG: CheR family methyltransferase [Desulfomonilia bacterium]